MDPDKSVIPFFYLDAVEMTFKSEQEGRPIFEDREFVRIIIAGDSKTEHVREVTREDKERWHEQYKRFKNGLAEREQMVGTPLKEWPQLRPSEIRMWEAMNTFTVEQIANASDTALQAFGMGARETQVKARAWLAKAADVAATTSVAAENDRLKEQIAALQATVKELAARIPEGDDPKRGPGRPRREAA